MPRSSLTIALFSISIACLCAALIDAYLVVRSDAVRMLAEREVVKAPQEALVRVRAAPRETRIVTLPGEGRDARAVMLTPLYVPQEETGQKVGYAVRDWDGSGRDPVLPRRSAVVDLRGIPVADPAVIQVAASMLRAAGSAMAGTDGLLLYPVAAQAVPQSRRALFLSAALAAFVLGLGTTRISAVPVPQPEPATPPALPAPRTSASAARFAPLAPQDDGPPRSRRPRNRRTPLCGLPVSS
ncbi:hypothetical protein DXV76_00105 [Rhodobacteraceae bacterium CCMM004]|nr:hypothetical protein DXV76_00105 [Rhodobacteraceae bacterium CCMM004]